jgi:hypothetical protein
MFSAWPAKTVAHIPNAQDAVGQKHRKHAAIALPEQRVNMHVPQSWNQISTSAVHYLRARRLLHSFAVSYFRNPTTGNDDSAVMNFFAGFRVDYRHMGDVRRAASAAR